MDKFEIVDNFSNYLFEKYPKEDFFIIHVRENWDFFSLQLVRLYDESLSFSSSLIDLEETRQFEKMFTLKIFRVFFRLKYLFLKWLVENGNKKN